MCEKEIGEPGTAGWRDLNRVGLLSFIKKKLGEEDDVGGVRGWFERFNMGRSGGLQCRHSLRAILLGSCVKGIDYEEHTE
jgi:hypothetical protein